MSLNPEREWAIFFEFPWAEPTLARWPTVHPERRTGLEFHDGWGHIYEKFCRNVATLPIDDNFAVVQAKEKFGRLVIYTKGSHDKPWAAQLCQFIDQANIESGKTCENCAMPGSLRQSGYVITLCDICFPKWDLDGARGLGWC